MQQSLDTLERTVSGAVAAGLGHFTVRDMLKGFPAPTPAPRDE
nr:hypothetical protein [Streptomyces sp. CHD11]